MPTHRLTVKYVNPPKEGKKRGSIKGTDDSFFLVVPSDLRLFEKDKTYDVVYIQHGEWKTIQSATLCPREGVGAVEASPQRPTSTAAPSASAAPGGHGGELKDEQIFVCALLKEAIRGGLVSLDKDALTVAIKHIRAAFRAGFGSNTFTASEAGAFVSSAVRVTRG